MSLHAWTLVMTSVPANALQVALLAEAGMCFRHREPDLTLLIITVVPLYLLVMYYCLVARGSGYVLSTQGAGLDPIDHHGGSFVSLGHVLLPRCSRKRVCAFDTGSRT